MGPPFWTKILAAIYEFSHKTHPNKLKFKGMSAENIIATLMWDEIGVVHSRAAYSNNYSETHTSLNVCPNLIHTIRKKPKYCSSSMTKPSHTQACTPLRPLQKLDGHVATTTLQTWPHTSKFSTVQSFERELVTSLHIKHGTTIFYMPVATQTGDKISLSRYACFRSKVKMAGDH
jgi:hypothetical protein